ncbi:type I methionyl aminopeptidase [Candidatus Poriferisodalis sp.]|uniref:type I methionyl aminopeptidase n=1 Tax=Candidatus Poriferisodalis sp. TaxID=3101277 RepID=UPI003B011C9E
MGRRKRRVPASRTRPSGFEPVVAGLVSPRRAVPTHIELPPYALSGKSSPAPSGVEPSDSTTIDAMRLAGSAARRVLRAVAAEIAPGVTSDHLDEVCHETCIAEGGYPSPLNYNGFPKSLCTSANEIICHGIPDDRQLRDGDIVNCDVTIFVGGVHGDHSETFLVGDVDEASRRLVEVTRESMYHGIAAVRPGAQVCDIGRAIQARAESEGYGVVREFVGHGIGQIFHRLPNIPHYFDPAARTELVEGMTFTVEPMITAGTPRAQLWPDGWTAMTADRSRTAQFEHTVLVTADGAELLTVTDDEPQPFLSASAASRLSPDNWPRQLPTAAVRTG